MTALLEVEDLSVTLHTPQGAVRAVENATFTLQAGELMGIVGESGSGKSIALRAILGLLPRNAEVDGSVRWRGRNLLTAPARERAAMRGLELAMVSQDPMTALNPLRRIGSQIAEGPRLHLGWDRARARREIPELLAEIGIQDPERVARSYPHQLSGGMRQRVLIAAALACRPALLLCDEPTTALDVSIQAQILDLLARRTADLGAAVVFVSHDLAVVSQLCSGVQVMYAGQIVECGPIDEVFADPRHAYTAALLAALPAADQVRAARLMSIPGELPDRFHRPEGCRFHRRCSVAGERCPDEPYRLRAVIGDRLVDQAPGRAAQRLERGSSCLYRNGIPVGPVSAMPAVVARP